ncbi:MAG: bifunctional 5,10-methylenetetrahydrofolate dehydrogenase/5,10-methenyltetrahydrofolate cyclohydrolase [Candidatus Omnitrophota bacterium]
MSAQLLQGKPISQRIRQELKRKIADYKNKHSRPITLASIAVGDDAACGVYLKAQEKAAGEVGIDYRLYNLPQQTTAEGIRQKIGELNSQAQIDAIILQMPLPEHIDYKDIARQISPAKDAEGMHPENLGRLVLGRETIVPCTPAAVMLLLGETGLDLRGKETVVVGHSEIVGKPLTLLLLNKFATVSVCHIGTSEAGKLKDHIQAAEVLIVAVGRAGLVKKDWIRTGAVVIDVGINRIDGKIVGDVQPEAQEVASFITPVPGGVGPLTVTMLMKNVFYSRFR